MLKLVPRIARGIAALGLLCAGGCTASDASVASRAAPAPDAVSRLPMPPRREAPRLSRAQPYRPCPADDLAPLGAAGGCGVPGAPPAAPPTLATAVAAASARARTRVDADALHALALADLAWSDAAGNALDRSITTLRTVARLHARPAPALADLAAALLVRAERRRDARDLFEAADVASLALESDSAFAPARFNLALALGRIGLVDETARAWAAFLSVEPRGPWADEARRRAARVAAVSAPAFDPRAADLAAAAARAPQEARLYGWNEALGRWGAATLARDAGTAARELAWARTVGRALEARGGDATLADAVRVIDGAAPNERRTRALAAAHRAFARAAAEYAATRYVEAGRGFAAAAGAPGPLGLWARAFGAGTAIYIGRRAHAEGAARQVLTRADSIQHPALVAQATWVLGTALLRIGRTEAALREYRAAASAFARAGEREHLGAVRATAAYTAYLLGDPRATAGAVRDALVTLRPYRASLWRYNALYAAALDAGREGFSDAALHVQNETVRVAERSGLPVLLAEAWTARARMAAARGPAWLARARVDVEAARHTLAALPAGVTRDWVRADLQMVEARIHLPADAARATAGLDSAVAYFDRPRTPAQLVPALVARADAHLRAGAARRAGADLDRAVALLAAEQDATASLPLRASLFDAARRVVDRAMALDAARGSPRTALARLERGRAAADPTLGRTPGRAARERAPRPRAPSGTVALVYRLVGDTLFTWTVVGTDVQLAQAAIQGVALGAAVNRARAALELRTTDGARPELARLYDWLVRPVVGRLGPLGTPLVVVADGLLDAVPFAALLDAATGRYLVEEHVVHHTPSLGTASNRPTWPTPPRSVLAVADPALGPSAPPGLHPLPAARAEARDVAAVYRRARLVAGADASVPAVVPALARAAVVHYAGHAIFDDKHPERSALLLAPAAAGMSGALTAGAIAALDLRPTRLVVLSACETARTAAGRGGFAGLAGAFLTAGAGGVVAAAWRVDDEATRALMGAFHRAYARSGDAPRALQHAQLALLRSRDPALRAPAAWAGFRYFGR